jgi:DNA-binding NarL/FixJ family response regulator
MRGNAKVLIAAGVGRLRDSLQNVLLAMPWVTITGQAADDASALRMVVERHPTLVLLDVNLPDGEVPALLEQIKARWPDIRCLVLADNARQRQAADAAGADSVLIRGFSVTELFAAIEELSREKSIDHRAQTE